MTERRTLTLTDPRAIRVLAHAARQQLLDEFSRADTLTATEAAALCGISPSAMSYHLRAMERWGLVERAESTDGRERPWRRAADSIQIANGSKITADVANSMMSTFIDRIQRTLQAAIDRDDHATIAQVGSVYLTDAEAKELDELVHDAMNRFDDRHVERTAPAGARRRDLYWLNLPRP
ncbi:helix-turn-helix domain-containing protein [Flexivirga caeni]|nr:helix-turn-helix domain-containing protein [Flexivirga caeni]